MVRPKINKATRQAVYRKTGGKCYHCRRQLGIGWHVDHYPVAYKDIENQMLLGITDPLDIGNLVPSCPRCNTSHAYESTFWCGHSQFPCKKTWGIGIIVAACTALVFTVGFFIGKYSC
jgi:hypothetical protein